MAIIVNFDLEGRDLETALICLFSIFYLLTQYRDNLEKAYLLSQIILWLEMDFLPKNLYINLDPVRYFPYPEINRFKIDS
jgi:hypothetical protein